MKNYLQKVGWKLGWITNLVLISGGFLYAQTVNPSGTQSSTIDNPIAADTFPALLNLVLKIIIDIGLPIVIIAIIFVGFKYVMAQGKPDKLKEAHSAFMWVLVGAAIVLGSYAISAIIQNTVNQVKTG